MGKISSRPSNPGIATPVTAVQGLLDFSPHAYNVTLYYEKFGLSARARYTWRDAFRTLDTAGGATLNSTLGFPVVTGARGQLNASITYDVTDYLNIGVEGVNLTKSRIEQYCVNDGALLCFQGLPRPPHYLRRHASSSDRATAQDCQPAGATSPPPGTGGIANWIIAHAASRKIGIVSYD